jgi:thioredoxin-related protein
MKNIILTILAVAPIFISAQTNLKNEINWVSLEDAKILAKKYNEKILIFFYKKNCPYCDQMKNINIFSLYFFANILASSNDTQFISFFKFV